MKVGKAGRDVRSKKPGEHSRFGDHLSLRYTDKWDGIVTASDSGCCL